MLENIRLNDLAEIKRINNMNRKEREKEFRKMLTKLECRYELLCDMFRSSDNKDEKNKLRELIEYEAHIEYTVSSYLYRTKIA